MAHSPVTTPRWKYALLAAVVFVYMITMLDVTSTLVVAGAMVSAGLESGGLTGAVVEQVYAALQDNINAVSAASYLLFGVPLAIWVLMMHRSDRRRERALRLLRQAHAGECSAPIAMASSEDAGAASAEATDAQVSDESQHDALGQSNTLEQSEPGQSSALREDTPDQPASLQQSALEQSSAFPQGASGQLTALQQSAPALPTVRFTVRGIDRRIYVAAVLIAYGIQLITKLIMMLVAMLLPQVMDEYNTLVTNSGIESYGFMWVISTLVLPPLVEETGFRGLGLTYLERAGMPFWVANVVQALAFGIFHMNLTQGLYTFVIGLLLGYLVHKSGSLAPGMLMHAVYNLMGTLGNDVLYTVFADPTLFTFVTCIAALVFAHRLLKRRNEDRGNFTSSCHVSTKDAT